MTVTPSLPHSDIVTNNGLHYSYRTESGVLFHLIGALSEWGKIGVTVIANSHDEVLSPYTHLTLPTKRIV